MMIRRYILTFWLGLLLLIPIPTLAAISSQEASDIARQHIPGRVLAVKQLSDKGRTMYQVKLLNKQREVHIIFIDANSGKRIKNR